MADLRLCYVEIPALIDHGRDLFPVGHIAVVTYQAFEQCPIFADGAGANQRIDFVSEFAHQVLFDCAGTLAGNTVVGCHRAVGR